MIRKILKWTGIVLLSLIALIALIVSFRQDLKYEAPYPDIKASSDSAVIAHGRDLVLGPAHCVDCHYNGNADSLYKLGQVPALTGGYTFSLPFGNFYSRNITPDAATGIGRYTDKEIARILRYGVKPDGTAALDFMPFHDMTDEDLTAVISYLRSQKPVHHEVPEHDINLLGKVIKAFLVKPVGPSREVQKSIKKDTSAAYGSYLAYSVAACNECHTPRNGTGEYIGEPFAGGNKFEEPGHPTLIVPNLTPHKEGRINGWSQQDFIKRFRMGKIIPYSHMPWTSFGRMSDDDLKAIYNFLKTLKPVKTGALLAKK